jgi:hypothetical protein
MEASNLQRKRARDNPETLLPYTPWCNLSVPETLDLVSREEVIEIYLNVHAQSFKPGSYAAPSLTLFI